MPFSDHAFGGSNKVMMKTSVPADEMALPSKRRRGRQLLEIFPDTHRGLKCAWCPCSARLEVALASAAADSTLAV